MAFSKLQACRMACLIEGVYALQKDGSMENNTSSKPASDWWVRFKYKRVNIIRGDEEGDQIEGAVFKWSRRLSILRPRGAPKVVIALRGTVLQGDTLISDLKADWSVMALMLHKTGRFSRALKEVEDAVTRYGVENVCITGHSLGSAVCLMVGRALIERGIFIDAHLFNPPFPSRSSANSTLKFVYNVAFEGLVAAFDKDKQVEMHTALMDLKKWNPHLYVNRHDPICSSYIAYSKNLREIDFSSITKKQLAASHSLRELLHNLFGDGDAVPFYLIPCFHLYVAKTGSKNLKKAHGLKQWWSISETEIEELS